MIVDPKGLMAQCHPDLRRVVNAASQSPQPWVVDYGLRTLAAEQAAVASGHSETLHSRHLPDPHYQGEAMAFDFYIPGPDGQPDWTVADAAGGKYGDAAHQILEAAAGLGIKIQWGGQVMGAWVDGQPSHFRDWGHIQLDPSVYP